MLFRSLASTVKSNAAYIAINQAMEYIEAKATIEVPNHLRNFPSKEATVKYQYPHDYPGHFIKQNYSDEGIPQFYKPSEIGREKALKERLESLWN